MGRLRQRMAAGTGAGNEKPAEGLPLVYLRNRMAQGQVIMDTQARGRSTRVGWMPTTSRAAAAAAVVFVGYGGWLLWGRQGSSAATMVDSLFPVALGLVFVLLAAVTARSADGRERAAWVVLAIGLAAWLLGDVLWVYYELVARRVPFPSPADAAYLACLPIVCVALLMFPGWPGRGRVMLLDGVIVTCSFFLISWVAVMRTVWRSGAENRLEFLVSLAYPAGDFLVMTVGVLVVIRVPARLRTTLALLVAGLGFAVLADSGWVYLQNSTGYSIGSAIDILWVASALLIIVALVSGYHAESGDSVVAAPPAWWSLWLPYVPLAIAAIVVATTPVAIVTETPVVLTGLVLVGAMLLRQSLVAADLVRSERDVRFLADRMATDIDRAAKYAESILPGELDGPVQVSSRYLPAAALGGDSFDYTWIDDDHLLVYLLDVSGHGLAPALLSISVHNLLRSGSVPTATLLAPDRVLTELNRRMGMDEHDDLYFTMWIGVYQTSTGNLRYAAAGHPPALALTEQNGTVRATPLAGGSMPLGMFSDAEFAAESYLVPAGARILLYSDGVLGDQPSLPEFQALCTELAATSDWSLDLLIDSLSITTNGQLDDDCALVELRFPDPGHINAGG